MPKINPSPMPVLKPITVSLIALLLLSGCNPSAEEQAKQQATQEDQRRIHCLDHLCPGDKEPPRNWETEELLKLNGRWFVGPKAYFSSGRNGAIFFWPSKYSMADMSKVDSPESRAEAEAGEIEIFLRSHTIPPEPRGYALIQLAEKNDWITQRRTLRSGLDRVEMKHVIGPRGHYIDHVSYYIATDLRGVDGLPPVTTCSQDVPESGGGTGFLWKYGIWVGTRMNQKHCPDWPEIYPEVMRVLSLLREIKQ